MDAARLIRDDVSSGRRSAVDVCREALARIEAAAPLNAFNLVMADRALARARAVDAKRAAGASLGLLAGVPMALKDNICVKGARTTASSRILDTYVPPYDATVVERLEAADAIIVAKTNCDEFAMGSSNENSAFGPVRNPRSSAHAPGGSSGGSAVAVAAGCVPLALGSDTGGSIRQPASFCGILGLKPTYGRVSRYGLMAFASSLDQIGPFAHTAEDAALVLAAMAGRDAHDATSSPEPVVDWTAGIDGGVRGLRVGVPRRFLEQGLDGEVARAFAATLGTLTELGAALVDIDLPHASHGVAAYYLVCTAEASSNLARYDGVKYGYRSPAASQGLKSMYTHSRSEGFGAEVKRRIMLGTYVLSAGYYDAYYLKAQQVRTLLRRDYERAFESVDVVATPTCPTPPFRLGEKVDDPVQMYLADVFTVSANLAGLPAVSVPGGMTTDDASPSLPIGFQLTGRAFDEATLLRAARALEGAKSSQVQTPPAFDRT
jgi:aspartyl-tRNA(Asn)/glutamyl-tRNA(Gln) amidotransferase subunit A